MMSVIIVLLPVLEAVSFQKIIYKRNYKCFNEQAFLHDVYHSDLNFVCEMVDVKLAWDFFKTTFLSLIDKHAPLRRFRISGKDNPWFNENISSTIRERDRAWSKAN